MIYKLLFYAMFVRLMVMRVALFVEIVCAFFIRRARQRF